MDAEMPVKSGHLIVSNQSAVSLCTLSGASRHGMERLEIFDQEDDKNPKIITLENCVKISQEPAPANQITVVMKTGTLTLNVPNETELKSWVEALQRVAFKDTSHTLARNSVMEAENDLYRSSFGDGKIKFEAGRKSENDNGKDELKFHHQDPKIVFCCPTKSTKELINNKSSASSLGFSGLLSANVFWKLACVLLTIVCLLIVTVIFVPISEHKDTLLAQQSARHTIIPNKCSANACKIHLVETIPDGVTYPDASPSFMSTFDAWKQLIKMSTKSMDIGSFYWSLRGADFYNHSTAWQGEQIFDEILNAGTKRGIKIRIAQRKPLSMTPDTAILVKQKAAEVRSVDFGRLFGSGVLHSKFWIVDDEHFYLGSANMDWLSLTQVKELGALVTNCSCLAADLKKVFNVYWDMGQPNAVIPPVWPKEYNTRINDTNPLALLFNGDYTMSTFISSSPPPMSPQGREQDIDAILKVIDKAQKFVHVSVKEYIPMSLYTPETKYWPVIDNVLRAAAIDRHVSVKLLVSWGNYSRPAEEHFLNSLQAISGSYPGVDVQIRRSIVPATEDQAQIPYARLNHNKFVVTEKAAYIGTSNWAADYFVYSSGVGLVLEDSAGANGTSNTFRSDLASVFERDWNSKYSMDLKPLKDTDNRYDLPLDPAIF